MKQGLFVLDGALTDAPTIDIERIFFCPGCGKIMRNKLADGDTNCGNKLADGDICQARVDEFGKQVWAPKQTRDDIDNMLKL